MGAYPFHPLAPPVANGPQRRPLQVLVVDDDELAREGLAQAVRSFGHKCRVAASGEAALAAIAESPADVVISDWSMPGMSGPELCRRTRAAADDAPYTYFIFLTGFGDREHLLEGMAAGADDYQQKPVDLDELEARLVSAARVVALHRRLSSRTEELRHDSKKFYAASRTDALTGAGNRVRLDEEVALVLARAQRYGNTCSLAICDLDNFKSLNDEHGHIAGDEALQRVADTMRANLRTADALFRYGGDELVVLLFEQPLDEAIRAMDRVRAAIEGLNIPSSAGGRALTVSIGVAEVDPARDHTTADWIARADAALYVAKAGGRNCVAPPAHHDA